MTESNAISLGIIGVGPRGLSVAERLVANAAITARPLVIHLVDPFVHTGGRVWRVDQSQLLLMNTVAAQVTMFTDDSVLCAGPIVPGPSLYEWAQLIELEPAPDYPPQVLAEAARLSPDSYPTRAFYGQYLRWVLDRVQQTAPANVTVHRHARTAVGLTDAPDGSQTVTCADGTKLTGLSAVVLTLGHVDMPIEPAEQRTCAERPGLTYLRTGNPAEADLDRIAPGQPVGLRGLGLNFFDHMTLLTLGRGGRFIRTDQWPSDARTEQWPSSARAEPSGSTGRLTYVPSGAEPLLFAGSRRGVPYHSRGENQKGAFARHVPLFLTPAVISDLRRRRDAGQPVEFVADIWPLIDREVRAVYYQALFTAQSDPKTAAAFADEFGHWSASAQADDKLLDRYAVPASDRWDWQHIARPYGNRQFTGPADYRDWLLGYLRRDVHEARLGNVTGPMKAALDVMRDLRNEIRLVVDHGGITGRSYRDELQRWYTPLNAFVSIGPPPVRIEEMIALIEAGVLTVLGPGMHIEPAPTGPGLQLRSTVVPNSAVTVTALIEARLPEVDLRTTEDPLLRSMLRQNQCRGYEISDPTGSYRTGALAVTRRPCRLVERSGRVHPRRYALSVPTEIVHWATAAGIRPGVDSVILGDADAIARSCLLTTPLPAPIPAQRPARSAAVSP